MNSSTQPLVSICIPTYNGAKYLSETLDSALNQTYSNIEIIITDDHSTDDSLKICNQYAQKDNRIKVFKNPKNLGLIGNWNESVQKANSDWIKFLFQDDLLTPTCIEKMITSAITKNVDIVICSRKYLFQKGISPKTIKGYTRLLEKTKAIFQDQRIYKPSETAKAIAPHIFYNCIGEPPTFLFQKKHYAIANFDTNYYQLMDYLFILNKILVSNFVYIKEDLVQFRIHNDSESMKNSSISTSDNAAIQKAIHIKFYERILICEELLNNPIFKDISDIITVEKVITIKKWLILKSYRKFGFKNASLFYKKTKIYNFIITQKLNRENYLSYKINKIRMKNTIKKYWL